MPSGHSSGNGSANNEEVASRKGGLCNDTSKGNSVGEPIQATGSWTSFLKVRFYNCVWYSHPLSSPDTCLQSISSFNGDLSSLTAPPFILSTKSLVEYSTHWAEHPSIFVAPADEDNPEKRALLVLKWFITTLKQQYCSRSEKLGSEKKPLNPFLGELFLGKWNDEAGTTQLVSEQVSHHPPVTAYCIWNDKHGLQLQGYNGQKASFSGGRINVKQVGHAMLHLKKYNEDYLITFPSLHIEGLVTGSPFVELEQSSYIRSSTGFVSKIDYSGRGWLSGKKNSLVARLYAKEQENDELYKIDGQWSRVFIIHDMKKKKVLETIDTTAMKTTPLQVAPIAEQDPLESRRAWQKVAEAIRKGDMDKTSAEKSAIENIQRALRKKEQEEGKVWPRRFFKKIEQYPVLEKLAASLGIKVDSEKTNGIWVFDSSRLHTSPDTKK